MPANYCTIITSDYFHCALALRDSLCQFNPDLCLHVLITDEAGGVSFNQWDVSNLKIHQINDVCASGLGRDLHAKYHGHSMDRLRWSLKPVFLNYLFARENVMRAIYVDSDIFFFNPHDFLFLELDSADILLSPHWRSSDPVLDAANFEKNLIEGLFNGGFIGATAKASHILDWWARACLYECVQNRARGLYDDQKYLDMMPVFFEGVKVLRHRGCNVAEWNAVECRRLADGKGGVLINGVHPVVFIHFTPWLYRRVLKESDTLLDPYLQKYVAAMRRYKPDFELKIPEYGPQGQVPSLATKIKWKICRMLGM